MSDLLKIGDICEKLKVTSRTLRYYEEIGLIDSIRDEDSNYRYYAITSIPKLKQILALRRLTFSIKEIQEIFTINNSDKLLELFNNKVLDLKSDIDDKEDLVNSIQKLIELININSMENMDTLSIIEDVEIYENNKLEAPPKESTPMEANKMTKLLNDIRILNLRPMKVAYYVAKSEHPEDDAWKVMSKWVKDNNLDQLFATRYFGFNNPNPTADSNIYGYEVWVTVGDDVKGNDEIGIKTFEGGLYAVATTNMFDIVASWQQLVKAIAENDKYKAIEDWNTGRWLEEHLIVGENSWESNMQVDLYYPVRLI